MEPQFFFDLWSEHPPPKIEVIFDVGANVGRTYRLFRSWSREAKIYAFEPVPSTFTALKAVTRIDPNVVCEQLALGREPGTGQITSEPLSELNHILAAGERTKQTTDTIRITTGDIYCAEAGVSMINLLKIDTEGMDLQTLIGFSRMLAEGRIHYVQVEAGMNPDNKRHIPLGAFSDFLEPNGYRVFGFYNQRRERKSPRLRRADVVFAHQRAPRLLLNKPE